MFILTSNMFGLAILSLGILGVIVSLLISNRRRFLIGISLSGFLVVLGIFYVVDTSLRQWWTARSIAKLQAKNRETLDLLKNRSGPFDGRGAGQPNAGARGSSPTTSFLT